VTPKETYEEIKRLRTWERTYSKKLQEIPWIETARALAWAVQQGFTQKEISRETGIHKTILSRTLSALDLPPAILAFHDRYSKAVFLDLGSSSPRLYPSVQKLMEAGEPLTHKKVRELNVPYRTRKSNTGSRRRLRASIRKLIERFGHELDPAEVREEVLAAFDAIDLEAELVR
jgi:hypothetical protein